MYSRDDGDDRAIRHFWQRSMSHHMHQDDDVEERDAPSDGVEIGRASIQKKDEKLRRVLGKLSPSSFLAVTLPLCILHLRMLLISLPSLALTIRRQLSNWIFCQRCLTCGCTLYFSPVVVQEVIGRSFANPLPSRTDCLYQLVKRSAHVHAAEISCNHLQRNHRGNVWQLRPRLAFDPARVIYVSQ